MGLVHPNRRSYAAGDGLQDKSGYRRVRHRHDGVLLYPTPATTLPSRRHRPQHDAQTQVGAEVYYKNKLIFLLLIFFLNINIKFGIQLENKFHLF